MTPMMAVLQLGSVHLRLGSHRSVRHQVVGSHRHHHLLLILVVKLIILLVLQNELRSHEMVTSVLLVLESGLGAF